MVNLSKIESLFSECPYHGAWLSEIHLVRLSSNLDGADFIPCDTQYLILRICKFSKKWEVSRRR
jgi:hypothetical protein